MIDLRSEKGSTLLLVVITVAILSVLGTALLAMSLMNINMKQNDYRIKQSQYYAESGIDQVYAFVGKIVADDIEEALNQTTAQIDNKINLINTALVSVDAGDYAELSAYPNYESQIRDYVEETSPGSGEYVLLKSKIEEDANDWYLLNFKLLINSHETDPSKDTFKELIENAPYANIRLGGAGSSVLTVTVDSSDVFPMVVSEEEFVINNIYVSYKDVNGTLKEISTDIVISDNIKDFPVSTVENRIAVPDNPLWQQAIVANGAITFSNVDVKIEGDVYGYAQIPSGSTDITTVGGVNASGSAADVEIDGNVFSRGHVQVSNGSANMTINNGLVYANSFLTQSNATAGILTVNGNVYTQDDLELNGANSKIYINGSYFGFTDGSTIGSGSSHDKSSAIVINEDMIGEELRITGSIDTDNYSVDYEEIAAGEVVEGALIGGTAYINVGTKYQTAESVSIKRNYISYTWDFANNQDVIDALKTNTDLVGDDYSSMVQ